MEEGAGEAHVVARARSLQGPGMVTVIAVGMRILAPLRKIVSTLPLNPSLRLGIASFSLLLQYSLLLLLA